MSVLQTILNTKVKVYSSEEKDFVFVAPTAFERDGRVYISGEDGNGVIDYYCEFGKDACSELQKVLDKNDWFIEWMNPGLAVVCTD